MKHIKFTLAALLFLSMFSALIYWSSYKLTGYEAVLVLTGSVGMCIFVTSVMHGLFVSGQGYGLKRGPLKESKIATLTILGSAVFLLSWGFLLPLLRQPAFVCFAWVVFAGFASCMKLYAGTLIVPQDSYLIRNGLLLTSGSEIKVWPFVFLTKEYEASLKLRKGWTTLEPIKFKLARADKKTLSIAMWPTVRFKLDRSNLYVLSPQKLEQLEKESVRSVGNAVLLTIPQVSETTVTRDDLVRAINGLSDEHQVMISGIPSVWKISSYHVEIQ